MGIVVLLNISRQSIIILTRHTSRTCKAVKKFYTDTLGTIEKRCCAGQEHLLCPSGNSVRSTMYQHKFTKYVYSFDSSGCIELICFKVF